MIIGRKPELKLLQKAFHSPQAEFVVVYGRRRIGKTFLIKEFFAHQSCVYFQATGIQKGKMSLQLKKFAEALSLTFFDATPIATPDSWDSALQLLHKQLLKSQEKVVIFLDELPWMASKKSGLLEMLDHYWNHYWSSLPHVKLVICGSSASWMIKKVINNKGGLHNRATCHIHLMPFQLAEAKVFLESKGIMLNNQHVLKLYMALGGVPYYLNYVEAGYTADENIQKILFDHSAPLRDEFAKLFESLFEDAQIYKKLIDIIGSDRSGMARSEIKEQLADMGGRLTERLQDLCVAGFVQEFTPFGRSRGAFYRLSDAFCLFYLYWLKGTEKKRLTTDYWIKLSQTPRYYAWLGYSFEGICYQHSHNIITALGIKTATIIDSWRFVPRRKQEEGAQIDLLIDRSDDAITLCEIKFTQGAFVLNKAERQKLEKKVQVFREKSKTRKQIFVALVSVNGVQNNQHAKELLAGVVTLDDLFKGE